MKALEKAKIALKKYVSENPNEVKRDLEEMKSKSKSCWTKQLGLK